ADSAPLALSSQVLSEFYWITTRKLRPSLTEDVAQAAVRRLVKLAHVVAVDASLVAAAIALARDNQLALWDAQIILAAARSGCDLLLTEDLNHGQVIAGVTIRDPFIDA
ncbi:MAG TPA: PIN domain-containing protein, partial [Trueperaceae bacterium]|nr:PIN domain-containing protein [Trueperaceae bacterium]